MLAPRGTCFLDTRKYSVSTLIVDKKPLKSEEEINRSRIDRCLAGLEEAINRCRTEDIRDGAVYAALGFLERCADEKWPFEQFRQALENFDIDKLKAEGADKCSTRRSMESDAW